MWDEDETNDDLNLGKEKDEQDVEHAEQDVEQAEQDLIADLQEKEYCSGNAWVFDEDLLSFLFVP